MLDNSLEISIGITFFQNDNGNAPLNETFLFNIYASFIIAHWYVVTTTYI